MFTQVPMALIDRFYLLPDCFRITLERRKDGSDGIASGGPISIQPDVFQIRDMGKEQFPVIFSSDRSGGINLYRTVKSKPFRIKLSVLPCQIILMGETEFVVGFS